MRRTNRRRNSRKYRKRITKKSKRNSRTYHKRNRIRRTNRKIITKKSKLYRRTNNKKNRRTLAILNKFFVKKKIKKIIKVGMMGNDFSVGKWVVTQNCVGNFISITDQEEVIGQSLNDKYGVITNKLPENIYTVNLDSDKEFNFKSENLRILTQPERNFDNGSEVRIIIPELGRQIQSLPSNDINKASKIISRGRFQRTEGIVMGRKGGNDKKYVISITKPTGVQIIMNFMCPDPKPANNLLNLNFMGMPEINVNIPVQTLPHNLFQSSVPPVNIGDLINCPTIFLEERPSQGLYAGIVKIEGEEMDDSMGMDSELYSAPPTTTLESYDGRAGGGAAGAAGAGGDVMVDMMVDVSSEQPRNVDHDEIVSVERNFII